MDDLIPLKKPKSIPILQEIRGSSLTLSAHAAMLEDAEIVSEGTIDTDDHGNNIYNGTTYISINLEQQNLNINKNEAYLTKLLFAVKNSLLMHMGIMRLVRMETERKTAPFLVRKILTETEFRIEEKRILVDIDIESPLALANNSMETFEEGNTK